MLIVGMSARHFHLERLSARMDDSSDPITVHLIDDAQHGAGRIWETDQTVPVYEHPRRRGHPLYRARLHRGCPCARGPHSVRVDQLLRGRCENISAAKREL